MIARLITAYALYRAFRDRNRQPVAAPVPDGTLWLRVNGAWHGVTLS